MLALVLACLPPTAATVPAPAPGAFPYATLTGVLSTYVNADGRVDYRGIRENRAGLDAYLASVAASSPASAPASFPTRNDALAYWLNAYNALAIRGVVDRPGLVSVHDNLTMFFHATFYAVGGQRMTLAAIENDVVRAQFKDPRVHFALNCQSVGCPRLPRKAFEPATLDAELNAAATAFATDRTKVWLDGDVAHVSQIFEWYADDFAASGGVIAWLDAHGAAIPTGAKLAYIPYDWGLIAQAGRGP